MDIVIDIQGFKDTEESFFPKEVAVVSVNTAHCAHWIIAQPYSFTELSTRSKSQNNWLSKNFHGIEWFEGDTPYKNLCRHLRAVTQLTNRIFTRGADKSAFIQRITSRNIINLEEEQECPSFHRLPQLEQTCLIHNIKSKTNNREYTCALNNALRIRKWLKDYGLLDSTSSSPLSPPAPSSSMTWYNRDKHQNTKEEEAVEEEENNSPHNSWWL
ncbi:uncharacterized protein LOC118648436 [Monomorium pharaonis]|uniref:uncharacterized protein LOC118648436 n=1 Tax=Monomorium pharaonis TaxID=307658 RepID=UPI0017476271|nr:uncharacterized protein LOC118648436 [Monomorium pharaonis]